VLTIYTAADLLRRTRSSVAVIGESAPGRVNKPQR